MQLFACRSHTPHLKIRENTSIRILTSAHELAKIKRRNLHAWHAEDIHGTDPAEDKTAKRRSPSTSDALIYIIRDAATHTNIIITARTCCVNHKYSMQCNAHTS